MSATIVPFIKVTTFGPQAVASMGEAFDRACVATAQLDRVVQEVIASRIVALAQAGERDPQVLCDHALKAPGIPNVERIRA